MNTTTVLELVTKGLADRFRVREYRGGFLITTATSLTDGTPFQLRFDVSDGIAHLNDDGQVAQELDAAGFDIESRSGRVHWSDIQRGIGFDPLIGAEPWELGLTTPLELLGPAVSALSEAAIQADSLRILAPAHRPVTMGERIIRSVTAANHEVVIKQRAVMQMRGGGKRQVTFSAYRQHTAYVQTATNSQGPNDGYDKALGTFSQSSVERERRLIVLDGPISRLPSWQLEGLQKVADVVSGDDVDEAAEAVIAKAA